MIEWLSLAEADCLQWNFPRTMGLLSWLEKKTTPLLAHIGRFDYDKGIGWVQKWSNLGLVLVKVMCGEFGEVAGIVGLVINFLAFGTPLLCFRDASSYLLEELTFKSIYVLCVNIPFIHSSWQCIHGLTVLLSRVSPIIVINQPILQLLPSCLSSTWDRVAEHYNHDGENEAFCVKWNFSKKV